MLQAQGSFTPAVAIVAFSNWMEFHKGGRLTRLVVDSWAIDRIVILAEIDYLSRSTYSSKFSNKHDTLEEGKGNSSLEAVHILRNPILGSRETPPSPSSVIL